MKWIVVVVLFCGLISKAWALRLPDGQLLSTGDEISKVYEYLGKPLLKYKTRAPCGAGRMCSVTRLVFKFSGRKWFIDTKNGHVVNITWTYR